MIDLPKLHPQPWLRVGVEVLVSHHASSVVCEWVLLICFTFWHPKHYLLHENFWQSKVVSLALKTLGARTNVIGVELPTFVWDRRTILSYSRQRWLPPQGTLGSFTIYFREHMIWRNVCGCYSIRFYCSSSSSIDQIHIFIINETSTKK